MASKLRELIAKWELEIVELRNMGEMESADNVQACLTELKAALAECGEYKPDGSPACGPYPGQQLAAEDPYSTGYLKGQASKAAELDCAIRALADTKKMLNDQLTLDQVEHHALQEVKTCADLCRAGWLISNRVMKIVEEALLNAALVRPAGAVKEGK